MQAAAKFFPKRVSTVKPRNAAHRATLRMWQRLQHIHANAASSTLTDADASQLREDLATWHRQAVTLACKQRAREFQDEVEEACRKGDAYLAHKTLRKLRPWEPQTRAQLQSSEGSLLTPQEELTMLETHVTKIFAKYPQLNRTVHSLPDMTGTLLGKHIGSIRPHKAVPTGSAPAAAWKLCASTAGASLAAHLSLQAGHRPCPATEALEAPLKDADMCFIPKPSKPATTPGNLRPLGIIRPDGKGLAGACRTYATSPSLRISPIEGSPMLWVEPYSTSPTSELHASGTPHQTRAETRHRRDPTGGSRPVASIRHGGPSGPDSHAGAGAR